MAKEQRQIALESFRNISNLLITIETNPKSLSSHSKDFHTFDLEKEFNNPLYKNLLLIFEAKPGGGAKFSFREDKKFSITIYVNKFIPNWNYELPRNIYTWFAASRSSFIHEFIHFLEFRQELSDELFKIQSVNVSNNQEYYNHPREISAYTQQGLHDVEWFISFWEPSKQKFIDTFGSTKESFIDSAIKKFFDQRFIKHLTSKNLDELKQAISIEYEYFLDMAIKNWS